MENQPTPRRPLEERRARGRPARADHVDPDVLLRHARQVFAVRGFDATSVREIARSAGVDPALMAHYFGSKEELWIAVVDQIAIEIAPLIDRFLDLRHSEYSSGERVEQALMAFIDAMFRSWDAGIFFSTAAAASGERLTILVERLAKPFHDAMMPLLTDAIRAGEIHRNDPETLYFMICHAISQTISFSHVVRPFSSLPERPEAFKHSVLKTALSMLGLSAGK